jgi:hypothetical protein
MTSSCSRGGVGHPIWVIALLLLVLNDHVLKGAGLFPGWLTGKLSDFAGLVVAPVLLTTLLGARSGWARAVTCAVVGLGFAAIKLSPGTARALERALALAHLDWRLWSDATDLVALVALPLAWWLAGGAARHVPSAARIRDRLLVIAGALACLATSEVDTVVDLDLVNRTRTTIPMARFVTDGVPDCAAIAAGDHELAGVAFRFDGCLRLEPGMRTPLGRIVVGQEQPPDPGTVPPCTVILLRAPGLVDTVLAWRATGVDSRDLADADIYVEEAGNRRFIAGTDYIQAWTAAFPLPRWTCSDVP